MDLDGLTRRELVSIEVGGNLNAREYLKKLSKESFEGYRGEFARKYVDILTKKVNEKMKEYSVGPAGGVQVIPKKQEVKLEEVMVEKPAPETPELKESKSNPIKADEGALKSKKLAVTFQPKGSNTLKNKTKLAGEKIDADIDFSKLTLGDKVSEDQMKSAKGQIQLRKDLFPEDDSSASNTGVKSVISTVESVETVPKEERGPEYYEKMKHKTAIGSDDFKPASSTKVDFSQFEGRSGFGSDDLNPNKKAASSSSGGVMKNLVSPDTIGSPPS